MLGLPVAVSVGWNLATPAERPAAVGVPGGEGGLGAAPAGAVTKEPVAAVRFSARPGRPPSSGVPVPTTSGVPAPSSSVLPTSPLPAGTTPVVTLSPVPTATSTLSLPPLTMPPVPTPTEIVPPPSWEPPSSEPEGSSETPTAAPEGSSVQRATSRWHMWRGFAGARGFARDRR
ncbi:hypothetical protein [Actinoplanes sp. URMC 104]|uniref:hypothetical protein n=1 Tax=Actinoplanes sp. URMC 104 TaxID=3423409 RepID=UPI003F1A8A06